jgi:hypothetical protein
MLRFYAAAGLQISFKKRKGEFILRRLEAK